MCVEGGRGRSRGSHACVRVLNSAAELDSGPEDESLRAAVVTEALASLGRLRRSPPSPGSAFTVWCPQPAVNTPDPFSGGRVPRSFGAERQSVDFALKKRVPVSCAWIRAGRWDEGSPGPALPSWRRARKHVVMLM